jgi:hypothetical protein
MASTFSDLGIELMATGENAGTWGDKTNTNLQIVEKSIAGYVEQAVTSGGTTALTITDGDATESTSVARHAVIKLTGTISGNSIVTVPDSIEKVYIVTNGTSGAYTVQFKTASGTGITFGVSEKNTKLVYSDGTNIVDAGFSGGTDLDGNELILDADADTSITADTDDQIDIKIAGADDFQFTANTFTAQSGSSIVVPEGGLTFGSTAITSTAAELNLLDGVSGLVQADLTKLAAVDSTAAELNIVDGGTSATSTTVADADRVVLNDNGTMVQVAVTDLAAYFDDEITAMPNLTSVGTLTTLTVDNVIINGTTIGHTSDTDLITLADGIATVAGEISVTTLDIGGTNVTATAAELNFIDGGATIGTTAIADGDGIIHNDNGTMKVTTAATFKTYFTSGVSSAADDLTAGDAAVNLTTSSGNITIDAAANDSDVIFKGTDNSSDITMLTLDGSDAGSATFNDKVIVGDGKLVLNSTAVTSTAAELNLLDGVSGLVQADLTKLAAVDSTAAELNIVDGGTSATSTTVADADRVVLNDNGTMVQVAVTDLAAYFDDEITAMPNLVTTAATTVGALNSGSITSGFGTIDTGSSTITTTGLISGGSLDIDNVLINGTTIGHTDDTDLLTVANGLLTIAGEISVTTLDIGGTNVTSTAAELNILDGVTSTAAELNILDGVTSTAAEINIIDGNTSATSTTLVDADRVVVNDNGTMVQVAMTDVKTYIGGGTSWQAVKTSNYTASAGQGVFANTTSSAFTVTLPASPTLGDEVSIVDYAGTFDSNALTVGRNSSKILGADEDLTVSTERAAFTLVFTDSTQGWLFKND